MTTAVFFSRCCLDLEDISIFWNSSGNDILVIVARNFDISEGASVARQFTRI